MVCEKSYYRHYKGGLYFVRAVGTHSETLEKLVVYENAAGDIWIRPLDMFLGLAIDAWGREVPRFSLVVPPKEGG